MTAPGQPGLAARRPPRRLLAAGLLLITLLAAGLRFAGLDSRPPGLFRDEVEKGYNAWALWREGGVVQLSGGLPGQPPLSFKPWPWMLNVNGSVTSAIYQYVDAPFVGLGGLTAANTRRAAALAGTLAVLALGAFAIRAWGGRAGLLCALWLALSPWHIIFSRWAQQSAFVPLWLALALGGAWGVERRRRWGWPLLGGALGWLFYTYSGAQPFTLAWGACLLAIYARPLGRAIKTPWPWLGLALLAIPAAPTVAVLLSPGGAQRLGNVAIWSGSSGGAPAIVWQFISNYFSHFHPGFLFLHGDPQPRHAMPGSGVLLWLDALLLPAGLFVAFRRSLPLRGALLTALLCGPLSAAITREAPHALRAFPMGLPCVVFSALGLEAALTAAIARLRSHGASPARARAWGAGLLLLCAATGLNAFARYWRACASDPAMALAFQAPLRAAWERAGRERQSGQRLFVSSNIVFAPYFQFFHERLSPLRARGQFSPINNVEYIDVERTEENLYAQPGDWILGLAPPISGNDINLNNKIIKIGEYSTYLRQLKAKD